MTAPRPDTQTPPPGELPPPLDPHNGPPHDRYCDLVMKGGVVDGIVYPWAIVELARHYRFQKLGGTSVGAMAAALTAAAEYQRRRGSNAGFDEVLRKMPQKLAEQLPDGKTRLLHLFQPQAPGLRLFQLFVALFAGNSAQALKQLLPAYMQPLVLALLVGGVAAGLTLFGWNPAVLQMWAPMGQWAPVWGVTLALGVGAAACGMGVWLALRGLGSTLSPARVGLRCATAWIVGAAAASGVLWHQLPLQGWSLVGWVPWATTVLAAGLALGVWFVLTLFVLALALLVLWWPEFAFAVRHNHFGLCRGATVQGSPHCGVPGLSDWLHEGIQAAAGLDPSTPLTFGQLWDAPGGPQAADARDPKPRSVELHVVTSGLAFGRPLGFPLAPGEPQLLFDPDEWQGYFPAFVLAHLRRHAPPYRPGPDRPWVDGTVPNPPKQLLQLPTADLPVLVAVRLSLSFPVLFSAVPLWAIDFREEKGRRLLRRCHFSDGGLASNFPIHSFDEAVPRWPTFGISLGKRNVRLGADSDVALSRYHYEGRADSWHVFDKPGVLARTLGFGLAVLDTMRCWNDAASLRLPGVRDRVVHIQPQNGSHGAGAAADVGGLNLALPPAAIHAMAAQGQRAGLELVRKFLLNRVQHDAWAEQRWVRFQTLVQGLRLHLDGLQVSARGGAHGAGLAAAITQASQVAPLQSAEPGRERPLTPHQAAAWQRVLQDLLNLETSLAALPRVQPYVPRPQGEYHQRPPV